jgi:hypothetical protein
VIGYRMLTAIPLDVQVRRAMGIAGFVLAAGLLVAISAGAAPFEPDSYRPGQDARAYWSAALDDPYVPGSVGDEGAYLYSPAFLQLMTPLRALPWTGFVTLWTAVLLGVLFWLTGPLLFAPLIVLAFPELWGGNITILLAAALVLGFRRPGAWAAALLTKVTPGIGVLWFAARREWRAAAEVGLLTAIVVGISAALAPDLWSDWFKLLAGSTDSSTVPGSIPIPLAVRLPIAVFVILVAAWSDRRWLLPVGAFLALPVIWWGSIAMLAGVVAMRREEIEHWLLSRLASLAPQGRAATTSPSPT